MAVAGSRTVHDLLDGAAPRRCVALCDALARTHEASQVLTPSRFNVLQVVLAAITVVAVTSLVFSGVRYGLLATPDMGVTGPGSYGNTFSWFVDRTSAALPHPPSTAYRCGYIGRSCSPGRCGLRSRCAMVTVRLAGVEYRWVLEGGSKASRRIQQLAGSAA